MKGSMLRGWIVVALLLGGAALAADIPDAPGDSRIGFVGENLFATADGTFHRWRFVAVEAAADDPSAGRVEVEIDVASLDTGIGQRDDHLRSADFFEVERWPTARVVVSGIQADPDAGSNHYRAQFEITIRDVTQRVEGAFELVSAAPLRVRGGLSVDRRSFGVGADYSRWNPMSIRPAIPIAFDVEIPAAGAGAR